MTSRHPLFAFELQSALDPAGTQAAHISHLWWLYFWVLVAVFAIVGICIALALGRARPRHLDLPPEVPSPVSERRISSIVIACVIATVVILFGLLFVDIGVSR